jgi:hypothetical protein
MTNGHEERKGLSRRQLLRTGAAASIAAGGRQVLLRPSNLNQVRQAERVRNSSLSMAGFTRWTAITPSSIQSPFATHDLRPSAAPLRDLLPDDGSWNPEGTHGGSRHHR